METLRSKGISRVFIAAVVVVIVAVSAVAAVIVYSSPGVSTTSSSTSSTLTSPATITVFGLVSTTGAGTHPVSMVFTGARTSSPFVAPVADGHFSVQLPNHDTYAVVTRWGGNYTGQAGQVERGQLSINVSAGSHDAMSYNVVESTPDSIVEVDGSVAWQIVTSNPVAIRFTSNDGENFTANISADRTFSIRLPNMMAYEVQIEAGSGEWYYSHQLDVRAGLDIVGITVKIGL